MRDEVNHVLSASLSHLTSVHCSPTASTEIEISKRQEDTIHRIFLDPTGNHLLACLHGGETFYLHSSTLRPKRLVKWSGVVVESVAFDAQRCTEVSASVNGDCLKLSFWRSPDAH